MTLTGKMTLSGSQNLQVLKHSQRHHYRRFTTSDGNFVAEHLHMRNAKDDVALTDGDAYMVFCADCEQHLDEALEIKEVCCTSLLYLLAQTTSGRNPLVIIILQ